jgi:hypothetical protein
MDNQSQPQANPFARIAIAFAIILLCELAWLIPSFVKAATQRSPTIITDSR